MNELLSKLEQEMETIWNKAYGPNAKFKLVTVFDMYDELNRYWNEHFTDALFWFEGYNVICEGLGDAYFMFNTDGPEQNDVIERLCALVKSNPRDEIVKREISKIREEKIKEDF